MRILAYLLAAGAATVWWWPMDRLGQSLVLALAGVLALTLRSSWRREEDAAAGTGPGDGGQERGGSTDDG